ncbi:MAG: TrmB family transcriptional regulator [Candidatus Methanofastidiosia archaeon]
MEFEDILNSLKEFGLGEYEIKTYLALLEEGKVQAKSLSSLTRIPYTKIYQVLQSLERAGFIILSYGKPRMYVPIAPKLALKKRIELLKEEMERADSQRRRLMKDMVSELQPLYENSVGDESKMLISEKEFWKVTGSLNVISILKEMIDAAKILRCTTKNPKKFFKVFEEAYDGEKQVQLVVRAPTYLNLKDYKELSNLNEVSLYHYADYNGIDLIIQDEVKALSVSPEEKKSKFSFDVYNAWIYTYPMLVFSLVRDFDLSLEVLEKY